MNPELNIISLTVKGTGHSVNEDNLCVGSNYVVVADGMGGESAGDIASKIVVESVEKNIKGVEFEKLDEKAIKSLMAELIEKADEEIIKYIDSHPDCYGMGTTILMAIFNKDKLTMAWCGDSRCLLIKDRKVKSLTKDHSVVQELIDAGKITEEESFSHPDNNVITRYVGGGKESCMPDFTSYSIGGGDVIIFCSDGLSGYCFENEIMQCIEARKEEDWVSALKDLALQKGSEDDITIVTLSKNYFPSKSRKGFFSSLFSRK